MVTFKSMMTVLSNCAWALSFSLQMWMRFRVLPLAATFVLCSMWLVGHLLSCTVLMKSLFICSKNVLAEKYLVAIVKELYTLFSSCPVPSFVHYIICYPYYIMVCVLP